MEHQYPASISGDESMLAELMLPDQTHVRSQDWTIFFLHKDTESDEEDAGENKTRRRRKRRRQQTQNEQGSDEESTNDEDSQSDEPDSTDDEEDSGEGPPLMYVLNLVNTKQDNTVRRYVYSF